VSDIDRSYKSASLLDYAEVNFYLADAAERSISGYLLLQLDSTIKDTASFNYWDFLMQATAYLLNPNVAYATAPYMASKIGNQL
jgi:hypothetical protein